MEILGEGVSFRRILGIGNYVSPVCFLSFLLWYS